MNDRRRRRLQAGLYYILGWSAGFIFINVAPTLGYPENLFWSLGAIAIAIICLLLVGFRWSLVKNIPSFWACTYLVLIPLFANLYMIQPAGFRQPTISNEGSLSRSISEDASKALTSAVEVNLVNEPHSDIDVQLFSDGTGVVQYVGQLEVLSSTGGPFPTRRLEFFSGTIVAPKCLSSDCPEAFSFLLMGSGDVRLSAYIEPAQDECKRHEYAATFPAVGDMASSISMCLDPDAKSPLLVPASSSGPDVIWMTLTVPQHDNIEAMLAAASGDPSSAKWRFPRYLYFSAVTITTLGYGDIVPVRQSARLLVGLEALLGIIVAGLFINATSAARTPREPTAS